MEKMTQPTLTDRVYERLLSAFTSHELKPGERLKLEDLAARMGISPTPLRQALARLEAEGIVCSDPRHGLRVVSLTAQDMVNLYEARLMCEVFAVEKAAHTITDAQLQDLGEILSTYEELAGQREPSARQGWVSKDVEYHRGIVNLAGNETISTWFRKLSVHVQTLLLSTSAERDPSVSIREHREIYQALAAHDAVACSKALAAHALAARDTTLSAMASQNSATEAAGADR